MRSFQLKKLTFAFLAFCFGLALVLAPQAMAQSYAALHGTVTDTTGAVIPNASVTVLNTSTGIKNVTKADKAGYYIFPQLQVGGPYTVTIVAQGFENFAASGLTLNVNDNREVNGKLQVGAEAQTVEVSATALQVETSNTQLEQIATSDQLEGVPLEGRDPAGLQKLNPGVVESSDRFGSFSSNGSQTAQNSYLVNGIDINDAALENEGIQINPDALQEENIVTSTMNPEFARNSGATVNQVLKAGTNSIHGSGFEFYRDTFLNNGNYFSQTRPVFHQNLYGGTIGGPVYKNKLFFFLAYQGYRNRTGATTEQTTLSGTKSSLSPTGQFAGAFSADSNYAREGTPNNTAFDNVTINPATGKRACPSIPAKIYSDSLSCAKTPFSVNGFPAGTPWIVAFDNGSGSVTPATIQINPSTWNTVASGLINTYVPQSNVSGTDLYNFNAANTAAEDQGIIRADYTPTSKDSVWGTTIFQSSPSTSALAFGGGSFPGFGMSNANHYKLFSASWTHTFSPFMLNELRGSYYRNPYGAVSPLKVVSPASAGFSISPQDPHSGIPYIGVGNYFDLGFSFEGPQPRLDTNLTYSDNFTWVHGNHTLKFGFSYEQFRVHNPFDVYNNGYYSFNGGGAYSSGDPLIDFSLGVPDAYYQSNNGFVDALASEEYAYGQDNWKFSPDLTLNFGGAWDVEQPNSNHQDAGLGMICWANSNFASTVFPGAPPGLSFPGDPGCNSAGGVVSHFDHFAPRIGFAWSPSTGASALIGQPGTHSFSIRGGFGLYFNRDQEEQSLQNLGDPPFLHYSYGAGDVGGSPAFANPFNDVTGNAAVSETNPFPWPAAKAGQHIDWADDYFENSLAAFDKNYNVPYTYNYNLNVQRAITTTLVAQIGYVGSVSHRLATWYEGDNITSAGHTACLSDPDCLGDPYYIHRDFPQYTAQTATDSGYPWYVSVAEQNSEGNSNYNSLQASLIEAPWHGLQYTAAYTWGHALDDGSGYESSTGSHGRPYNYVSDFKHLNYGSSDFDARQRLALSYVYTLPVIGFLRNNTAARYALAGWGIGGVSAFQTGYPITLSEGAPLSLWCDAQSYFGCADNPNTSSFNVKKLNPRSSGNPYFDIGSFSSEAEGTFGNTPRNYFHGPGFNYTNLQVSKTIHFTQDSNRYAEFRLEAYNAFNHANFSNPSGTFLNPNFGNVTSVVQTADPNGDPSPGRSVQLVGKFYF